jgi:hypothetical protein
MPTADNPDDLEQAVPIFSCPDLCTIKDVITHQPKALAVYSGFRPIGSSRGRSVQIRHFMQIRAKPHVAQLVRSAALLLEGPWGP